MRRFVQRVKVELKNRSSLATVAQEAQRERAHTLPKRRLDNEMP